MKYWAAEHVYEHPWHTVVNAAYRKYPNPMNRSITAIDVVQQSVDDGVLKTERVLQSQFSIPSWASKLTGFFWSAIFPRVH
uniref:PRELI/MSF1 domain-containing protein n=1 Tax=Ditylenchus dipsaci TaxID=166011 RepID=A0A915D9U7_9BILA